MQSPGLNSSSQAEMLDALVRNYGPRIALLPDKPEETLEATVRALWWCAAGQPQSVVGASKAGLPELDESQQQTLAALLEKRCGGVPLAHLTGRQHFMGLELRCSEHALIPRRETEILGNAAVAILRNQIALGISKPRVLDLCTGSGNLACAIASAVAECTVFAADLSAEATQLAQGNAQFVGCAERVTFFTGDLFAPFEAEIWRRSFDLIVCNPPYITSAKLPSMHPEIIGHEPRMAFDAGPMGLSILWRLLSEAPKFLVPNGWLAFEVGLGQGDFIVKRLAKDSYFSSVESKRDVGGNVRAIVAQLRGEG